LRSIFLERFSCAGGWFWNDGFGTMVKEVEKDKGLPGLFKLKVADLRDGPLVWDREIPVAWLKRALSRCEYELEPENGRLSLEISPCGNGVLVKGEARARLSALCGTCLARTRLDLRADLSTYLMPKRETEESLDDQELTPEDLEREWFEGEVIVLDELIRDSIVLELPMNPKCGDDCPGPPGASLDDDEEEIDPRLAVLASIKIDKEN
jgi:uncharacterized protein